MYVIRTGRAKSMFNGFYVIDMFEILLGCLSGHKEF